MQAVLEVEDVVSQEVVMEDAVVVVMLVEVDVVEAAEAEEGEDLMKDHHLKLSVRFLMLVSHN